MKTNQPIIKRYNDMKPLSIKLNPSTNNETKTIISFTINRHDNCLSDQSRLALSIKTTFRHNLPFSSVAVALLPIKGKYAFIRKETLI